MGHLATDCPIHIYDVTIIVHKITNLFTFALDGNEENYFNIIDSANNTGLIQVLRRIDREEISQFLLTVKCFKKQNKKNTLNKKSYNKMAS